MAEYVPGEYIPFAYSGIMQQVDLPAGTYFLEAWGASGGNGYGGMTSRGNGGHTSGVIVLTEPSTVYVGVGGSGENWDYSYRAQKGGFNGGGDGGYEFGGGGGGATHFALSSGTLNGLSSSQDKVLLVAGGGGGGAYIRDVSTYSHAVLYGGKGGGLIGANGQPVPDYNDDDASYYYGTSAPTGGRQNAGGAKGYAYRERVSTGAITYYDSYDGEAGSFGKGGKANASQHTSGDYAFTAGGGGGGGFYGGGGGSSYATYYSYTTDWGDREYWMAGTSAGAGGSSFLSAGILDSYDFIEPSTGRTTHYGKVNEQGVRSGNGEARIRVLAVGSPTPLYYYTGALFEKAKSIKRYTGSAWEDASKLSDWSGSNWEN